MGCLTRSRLPDAALSPAFRKLTRPRGLLVSAARAPAEIRARFCRGASPPSPTTARFGRPGAAAGRRADVRRLRDEVAAGIRDAIGGSAAGSWILFVADRRGGTLALVGVLPGWRRSLRRSWSQRGGRLCRVVLAAGEGRAGCDPPACDLAALTPAIRSGRHRPRISVYARPGRTARQRPPPRPPAEFGAALRSLRRVLAARPPPVPARRGFDLANAHAKVMAALRAVHRVSEARRAP